MNAAERRQAAEPSLQRTLRACRAAVLRAGQGADGLLALRLFDAELERDLGLEPAPIPSVNDDERDEPKSPALDPLDPEGPRRLGDLYQLLLSGQDRLAGGVHYTPAALVDEVIGPALGALFEAAWRRAGDDLQAARDAIAALRVLDPAMGGGHFLMGAALELCRELAWFDVLGSRRPAALYERVEHGDPQEGLDADQRRRLRARMIELLPEVIHRNCYGVDVDPLAAAIGEAALWCMAASAGATLHDEGLAGHIVCGDALVGLEVNDAISALRRGLALPEPLIRAVMEPSAAEQQPARWPLDLAVLVGVLAVRPKAASEEALWLYLTAGLTSDLPKSPNWRLLFSPAADQMTLCLALRRAVVQLARLAPLVAGRALRPLHPALAFPSVFAGPRRGFDAVVANPPFVGDRDLGGRIGPERVLWLRRRYTERGARPGGTPDLAGFFVLRYADLLAPTSAVAATLAPNTLAQGRSRRATLVPLIHQEGAFRIFRAAPDRPWPGVASVRICLLHLARPDLEPPARLLVGGDHLAAPAPISTYLDHGPEVAARQEAPLSVEPRRLPSARVPLFYQGMILRGAHGDPGDFVQPLSFADSCPPSERVVLRAYLNNETVQHQARPHARRLCIDFFDVLAEVDLLGASPAAQLAWLTERYPYTLAAIDDVRRRRQALPERRSNREHRCRWWLYGSPRHALRAAWRGVDEVLAAGAVGKIWAPVRLARIDVATALPVLPMHKLFLAPDASLAVQACLSSFLFEQHARRQCSTLGTGLNFAPTAALPGWPWPWPATWDAEIGAPTWRLESTAISAPLEVAMGRLMALRAPLLERHGGPTGLYNRVDDAQVNERSIVALRRGHGALLDAHLRAWGWHDLADGMASSRGGGWTFDRPWIDGVQRHLPALQWRVQLRQRLLQANEDRYWQELSLYRPAVERALAADVSPRYLAKHLAAVGVQVKDDDLIALEVCGRRQGWWHSAG